MSDRVSLPIEAVDPQPLFDQRKEDPREDPADLYDELRAIRKYVYALELELEAGGEERTAELVRKAWSRLHDAADRLEWAHALEATGAEPLPVLEGDVEEPAQPFSTSASDRRDRLFSDEGSP